jgi:photosystem II stability/assembly factor-like uncharacterized protein
MHWSGPMRKIFSLIILIVFIISGCIAQTPGTFPAANIKRSISPTKATIATSTNTTSDWGIGDGHWASEITETAVPSATALPTIEIGPQGTIDPSVDFPTITEIHMTSVTSGWAFAANGDDVLVLHTSDGGSSWRDVTPPIEIWSAYITSYEGFFPRLGECLFLDDSRAWISTLHFDITRPQEAYTGKVMLSTVDGGATWRMHKLPPEGVGYGYFVDFIDPMHGWFVVFEIATSSTAYTGLYRTVDGGESWETVLDGVGTSSGLSRALAFGDTNTGVMTISFSGWDLPLHVRWTHDGGTTWETQYLPEPEDPLASDPTISDLECGTIFPHAFSKLEVALIAECRMLKDSGSPESKYIFRNFFYSTQDGGMSWNSFPAPEGNLHLLNPNAGWMLGDEIHFTEDGGKSWTKINEVTWQGQFNFIDANHGWAVARNDDEIALVKTENGGRSWYIVEPQLVP